MGTPDDDKLQRYQEMRDFGGTPEPSGAEPVADRDGLPRFVVQEHHATSMHWDLRLERDGVLVSWAVPRGIPPDPKQNHLAVHTEDHPLLYLEFSGDIPAGHYGAGQMTIWDHGTYETEKWNDREVMVVLHGRRARGRYVLFRTDKAADGKQWMIHRMDPPEDPGRQAMPSGWRPMLATAATAVPKDEAAWSFEVKWDGIRALARISGGRIHLEARSGRDITHRYPELSALGRALGSTEAILDGEIVALDPATGRPSFERLQRRMHVESDSAIRRLRQDVPITYAIFDLLWLDGHPTIGLPYEERRRLLDGLALAGPAWHTPAAHPGEGSALLDATRSAGLEGVVAKRLDSLYEPGVRTRAWLKIKNHLAQEFVVGGFLPGVGSRGRLGALLLGVYQDDGRLCFAGRVGTGFTEAELTRLLGLLDPLRRDSSPFDPPPPKPVAREATWVEPEVVVEVAFTEWTGVGILRHPSYKGQR
ncbi:MAG TPA: non-homologous end-joining DNA ligase, partial [Acidimicrobiia bacterium]|nr:non-homologous end-joining DNA ligase [Acidimicrobiia bacterium]